MVAVFCSLLQCVKAASFPCLPRCPSPDLPDSLFKDAACLGQTTEYLTVRGWEAWALAEAGVQTWLPLGLPQGREEGQKGPASESHLPPQPRLCESEEPGEGA